MENREPGHALTRPVLGPSRAVRVGAAATLSGLPPVTVSSRRAQGRNRTGRLAPATRSAGGDTRPPPDWALLQWASLQWAPPQGATTAKGDHRNGSKSQGRAAGRVVLRHLPGRSVAKLNRRWPVGPIPAGGRASVARPLPARESRGRAPRRPAASSQGALRGPSARGDEHPAGQGRDLLAERGGGRDLCGPAQAASRRAAESRVGAEQQRSADRATGAS